MNRECELIIILKQELQDLMLLLNMQPIEHFIFNTQSKRKDLERYIYSINNYFKQLDKEVKKRNDESK